VPFPDEEINPRWRIGIGWLLEITGAAAALGVFFGVRCKSLIFAFFLVVSLYSTYVGPWVTGIWFVAFLFAIIR